MVYRASSILSDYSTLVNPQWQRLLSVLGMNVCYERCSGAELFTADGRRIIDFLAGYPVHNAGHNHPEIIAAIKAELDRSGPAMLQSHVPEPAGELAARLCRRAGGSALQRWRVPRTDLRRSFHDGRSILAR